MNLPVTRTNSRTGVANARNLIISGSGSYKQIILRNLKLPSKMKSQKSWSNCIIFESLTTLILGGLQIFFKKIGKIVVKFKDKQSFFIHD